MAWKPAPRTRRNVARFLGGCATLAVLACGGTPSTPSDGEDIVLLGSTPAPGATIDWGERRQIVFSFEVRSSALSRFTDLRVELLDVGGRQCGRSELSIAPQGPLHPVRVDLPVLTGGSGCPYPSQSPDLETRTLRVSLLATGYGPAYGTHELILVRSFPVRYTLTGLTASAQHTSPEITSLYWQPRMSSGFPEGQRPGRPNGFYCTARDADGGSFTITMTLVTPECLTPDHCWSETQTFASRLIDVPVAYDVHHPAPNTLTTGTLTCAVTQWGGATARRSVCYTTGRDPNCH